MRNNPDDIERRLGSLGAAIPSDPDFADRLQARITAEAIRPLPAQSFQLRRWLLKSSLGLAASVGIAAGVWSLISSRPAFAIGELPNRLTSLHSLHLKGTLRSGGDAADHPLEIYVREPDCYRLNGQVIDSNGVVSTCDTVCDADHLTLIMHATKNFVVGKITSTDARMQTAQMLQSQLQMMFGPKTAADFRQIRRERVAGVNADVYESSPAGGPSVTVWLNPKTQLPVQTELGSQTAAGPNVKFDTIEADPVIADSIFHPAVPTGYAVVQPKLPAVVDPDAAAEWGENYTLSDADGKATHLKFRYLVHLSNGDVLLCWCLYSTGARDQDLKLPDGQTRLTVTASNGTPYSEHLLHADATAGGWHWRWSVLRPTKPAPALTILTMEVRGSQGDRCLITELPVYFRSEDLPKQVELLQKQTLPAGAAPMTLAEIEDAVTP